MNQNNNHDMYYQSLNKVYEYIDANLVGDLRLELLAQISGYSEYHFHRLFHAMTGKSVHEYVHERRLTSAATRILYAEDSVTITQIALDCGFSSSGDFSRSFWKQFGCSPSNYRKNRERKRSLEPTEKLSVEHPANPEMDRIFSLKNLTDLHVAGIAAQGLSSSFISPTIDDAYKRLFAWLRKRDLVKGGVKIVGITMDTPEVLPLADVRYLACAVVDNTVQPEGEVFVRTVATAGKFVCFTLDRSKKDFSSTFFGITDYLYACYLPQIEAFPDNRPFVEYYRQNGPIVEITFCVPIK